MEEGFVEDLWESGRSDCLAVGASNQPSANRYVSLLPCPIWNSRTYRVSPEMMICQSPYVKYCAMFGSNRPCVGVLIEPDGDNVEIFDPAEEDLLKMFRNSVW
jgi:hypothetical protein